MPAEEGVPAEEEVHGSPWPILVGLGLGATFLGLGLQNFVIYVGVVVFAVGLGGWIYDDYLGRRVPHVPGVREGAEGTLEGFSPRKAAMWLFLASEIMFFSGIIGASWATRAASVTWVAPGEVLNVPLTALNTFILITSSLTMAEALRAARLGDQRALRLRLLLTLALGITFVSIQAFEYVSLALEGLTPSSSPVGPAAYGMTFYVQTGFHGAHVTGGIVAMSYVTRKAFRGAFAGGKSGTVELMGLYWHFVDVVWIFLFTIVYLI